MPFPRISNLPFETKVKAVDDYLRTGLSLRKVARAFGLSHKTLSYWVKLYRAGGAERLKKQKIFKKRVPRKIEKKVMLLKEQKPSLTISRAKELINRAGIQISSKGIWQIWQRYGLVIRKRAWKFGPLDLFVPLTSELEYKIEQAEKLVNEGNYRGAARILNSLPAIPETKLLLKIPEKFLSLRRRLDRLDLAGDEIPRPQFLEKIRRMRKSFEQKGYIYTSLIADFMEMNTLGWIRKPEEKLVVINRAKKKMQGIKNSSLQFLLLYEEASTYSDLLRVSKTLNIIKKCRKLLYLLPYPYYWERFGDLSTFVGKYRDAMSFYKMAFKKTDDQLARARLALKIAIYGYSYDGNYLECQKFLKKAESIKDSVIFRSTYGIANGYLSFGQGDLIEAAHFFHKSLESAYKGELHNRIFAASQGLSAVAQALNKKNEAKIFLQKYLSLMKNHRLIREELLLRVLTNQTGNITTKFTALPPFRLLGLLLKAKRSKKIGDYREVCTFAQRLGLTGLLHRWIVFFPEIVLNLLEKGKKTGLPKAILKLPIFNQEIPVYHIKFLGNLSVFKNGQYIKKELTPREQSFLIYTALEACSPKKSGLLSKFDHNVLAGDQNSTRYFSRFLSRLKKKLKVPGYLLSISSRPTESRIVNSGIYFTTDYWEFEQKLIQAKALQRAGEWGFARKEYLRAFKLFRGEPFKKNFDNWSVDMRFKILSQFETEAINFAKSCLEHGNKNDARKILQKVLKIIPDSGETQNLLETL